MTQNNESVEAVARLLCGGDDPDEMVQAGNPIGEPCDYPRWMLFQLDARKIIDTVAGISPQREAQLEAALREIENPITAMQQRADAAGCKLDGQMAFNIANDPEYLKKIARAALAAAPREPSSNAHMIDMANVGEALMEAIRDYSSAEFMKTWAPADCPSEIVGDLLNALEEEQAPPSSNAHTDMIARLPRGTALYDSPDYLDDPDGLERFRQDAKEGRGHDMAAVNINSLRRLIDTIDRLRHHTDALQALHVTASEREVKLEAALQAIIEHNHRRWVPHIGKLLDVTVDDLKNIARTALTKAGERGNG